MLTFVLDLEPSMDTVSAVEESMLYYTTKKLLFGFALFALVFSCYVYCSYTRAVVDILLSPWRTKMAASTPDAFCNYNEQDAGCSPLSCCTKRRARYWKCAKRRRRRAASKKCSQEDECALINFCKMHLPPPLPFMRRRRCRNTPCVEAVMDEEPEAETETEQVPKLTKVDDDSSDDSSLSEGILESTSSNKAGADRAISPTIATIRTIPTSQLIDLTRMQQWQSILERPQLKRREAKYRDSDGLYPLHWAAAGGPPATVIQALLKMYPGAAHKADGEGSMPLHFAAHYGATVESVDLLLQAYPAAARRRDKHGRTPLYHASDKSASLEVLKLLVHADPAMITTPCYGPARIAPAKKELQPAAQASSAVTRETAVRTPLFLVWASVLSDRQTRTHRRGKKWDKAVWMLQASYVHHCSSGASASSDNFRNLLLSASISMDVYLPEQVLSLMIAAYPEQLRIADGLGHLPLAVAASTTTYYSLARLEAMIEELLKANPAAAHHRNSETGRSALFEAILNAAGVGVLERLLRAAPEAIELRDGESGLPPALLAAGVSDRPATLGAAAQTGSDPFNLLTDKQHALLERMQGDGSDSMIAKLKTEQLDETAQLETIYKLLKANPAQILAPAF